MRLITHNMLKSNVKDVEDGYPLIIEVEKVSNETCDFDADFVKRMLNKLDYPALRKAASQLSVEIPDEPPTDLEEDLRRVHHALLEVHVVEGALICPESGRRFKINNGIPNMLLHEDEI